MIGSRPCAYACGYVDPVFISQSYDISISTSTRRTNLSVFLVLILMSTQFSLAYTSACAYAYALVKTSNWSQRLTTLWRHTVDNNNNVFDEICIVSLVNSGLLLLAGISYRLYEGTICFLNKCVYISKYCKLVHDIHLAIYLEKSFPFERLRAMRFL